MSNEFPPAGNPDPAPGRPPPTSSEPVDLDPLTQLAGARPQEPQHQQPQPPYQQPGYQQPEYQQPQYPQPQYPQPQYPQPQYQQPQYQQPQYQQPQYQQPQYQQPQYPQPGYVPAAQPVPPPGYGAGWDGTYRPPGAPQFTPSPSSTTVSGDRRRSALVPVLAAAVVLLVVALAGTAVWWTNTSGKNADQISALKSAHAAREKRVADAAAARSALVTKAALPGKLADVRVRTKKVRDEDVAWTKRSEAAQFSTLHTYAELQASCLEAVVLYDAAAATLTDAERGTDPAQVDMLDDSYNCQADRWNS